MALPGVSVTLENGTLGRSGTSDDSICGLLLTGTTLTGAEKVSTNVAYVVFSLEEAVDIGIEEGGTNDYAYQHIKEFYDTAGTGTELWLMLVAASVTMENMLDPTKRYAPALLDAGKGKIRKLGVSRKSASGITSSNGLDADVEKAMIKGQALAEDYAEKFQPFRFLVDGKDFSGTVGDLKDFRTTNYNRGGVLIGATNTGKNAAVGLTLGYMASLPVQRKISRVRNGALPIIEGYLTNGETTESKQSSWDSLHDKGYIFFRTFVGKSGKYYNDDPTATTLTDDYSSFSAGYTVDKALVIAYQTYVDYVGEEVEVDDDGNLNVAHIKDLQGRVESNIVSKMLANGEISAVAANIDPLQNVIATGRLEVRLRVRPVGYMQYIEVFLGFSNPANTK